MKSAPQGFLNVSEQLVIFFTLQKEKTQLDYKTEKISMQFWVF